MNAAVALVATAAAINRANKMLVIVIERFLVVVTAQQIQIHN